MESAIRRLREAIERDVRYGEVRPGASGGYVFGAIPAMMMYRSSVCGSELADVDLEEMIDQSTFPLLGRTDA